MEKTIKIATLPLNAAWCDVKENMYMLSRKLESIHPDTDLLVLPELFSTGFIQDRILIEDVASMHVDDTLVELRKLSKQYNLAICGSYLARDGAKVLNRGFFIEPSGDETFYDKRHLFCLSPESAIFTRGEKHPPVIRFRGWNISMIICYDLRFPIWCRNKKSRYDILLVPANWPAARAYAWKQLLIARAIENQSIVVGANRSGKDDYGTYDNLSYIIDAGGSITATTENDTDPEKIIYSTFTKSGLDKIRQRLPVGQDADEYTLPV